MNSTLETPPDAKAPERKKLQIFVNRRKFDEDDGVLPTMTGRQIAALVGIDGDNARITRERDNKEITADEPVKIEHTEHFHVIRKQVDGG